MMRLRHGTGTYVADLLEFRARGMVWVTLTAPNGVVSPPRLVAMSRLIVDTSEEDRW